MTSLARVRWAVRFVLVVTVAASVAANILHARPDLVAQTIAAWPPLALLATIELIAKVPVHSRRLAYARMAATVLIAGIAAWVSYWHMAGVAGRYGEVGASPYLLPLSVDGLLVVASVCLVELAGRARAVGVPAPVAAELAVDLPEPVADEQPDERSPKRTAATATIARARRRNPGASRTDVAKKTGLSLATVRRQWALTEPITDVAPVNGRVPELTT